MRSAELIMRRHFGDRESNSRQKGGKGRGEPNKKDVDWQRSKHEEQGSCRRNSRGRQRGKGDNLKSSSADRPNKHKEYSSKSLATDLHQLLDTVGTTVR